MLELIDSSPLIFNCIIHPLLIPPHFTRWFHLESVTNKLLVSSWVFQLSSLEFQLSSISEDCFHLIPVIMATAGTLSRMM